MLEKKTTLMRKVKQIEKNRLATFKSSYNNS